MTQSATENVLWDLFVLEYARSRNQPIASLVQGTYTEGAINVPFSFVVARSGDRVALIDTGFMREESGALMAQKFGIPEWISPLRLLQEGYHAEPGNGRRHFTCSFRSHGIDRQISERQSLFAKKRAAKLD